MYNPNAMTFLEEAKLWKQLKGQWLPGSRVRKGMNRKTTEDF